MSSRAVARSAAVRATSTRSQPSAASVRAVARPMPLEAPVMSALRPPRPRSIAFLPCFCAWRPLCGRTAGRAILVAATTEENPMAETALIVGAGSGLSAALARLFAKEGMRVALAARRTEKLEALLRETGAKAYRCDASKREEVDKLFAAFA